MHDASRRRCLKLLALPYAAGATVALEHGARAATPPTPTSPPATATTTATTSLLVGYAAGGSVDLVARTLAPALGAATDRAVSVVNIAGASGAIAAAQLALAPADGSTLMIGTPSEVGLSHLLRRQFRFDPLVDTTPVVLIGRQPLVWVTSARASPVSIAEWATFAARARRPLRYGTSGVGTPLHLAGETLRLRTGLPMQHVPYRGAGPVLQDLQTEGLDMAVLVLSSALPLIRDGRLRALGLTQSTPAVAAPGIAPLATLAGLEGLDLAIWFGLLGPPRLPPALVSKWRSATRLGLELPPLRQRLTDAGVALDPDREFASFLREEITRYRALVEAAGLTLTPG